MVNTANWDKFSKRIVLGIVVAALVAAVFLLLGIYIVGGAERHAPLASATAEPVAWGKRPARGVADRQHV